MRTTAKICYLEFINFSLGASGVVRQDLQNNNTQCIVQIVKITTQATQTPESRKI